jgi:hypothetical protein
MSAAARWHFKRNDDGGGDPFALHKKGAFQ